MNTTINSKKNWPGKFFQAGAATLLCSLSTLAAEPLIVADFNGADYGAWKTTGDAFGTSPARAALPGQMEVQGALGEGFVNSFHGGDDATGRLTSPPFKIERKHITFLIGGGGHPDETCMNLLIGSKPVRTAAGPNVQPGGSEKLSAAAWDVAEFVGKEATIEIVDTRKASWGHLNVDHIAQTDDRGNTPLALLPKPPLKELTREVKIEADFLQLPVLGREDRKRDGLVKFTIEADGRVLRFLRLDLAEPGETPEQTYSYDVREFRGKTVTLRYRSHDEKALERLVFNNTENRDANAYAGANRPQFHFSPRVGWMNDINGTYWHDGLYHLFYQYNPTNRGSGPGFDMHWGHSVSRDLLTWEEWPIALFPNHTGDCYSGTAVVAPHAVPGLTDKAAPLLFFSGTTPFSQHLATTPDGGKTWQRFAGNPVVKTLGDSDRDPKVVWHEASQHFCMVLFVGGPSRYQFLRSRDLVTWEQTHSIPGWYECPEFFPVKSAVTGEELWLLYGGFSTEKDAPKPFSSSSCYLLGRFDGKKFTPITEVKQAHEGRNFYGALTFANAPQGRNIMMGWTHGSPLPPGEKFNQSASVPLELTIKKINGEDTLCFEPVRELDALRGKPLITLKNTTAAAAQAALAALEKDALLDVTVRFKADGQLKVRMRNLEYAYDHATRMVKYAEGATLIHPEGTVSARFLVDRGIAESFWNGGEASYCTGTDPKSVSPAFAIEGDANIEEFVVYPMRSIWK